MNRNILCFTLLFAVPFAAQAQNASEPLTVSAIFSEGGITGKPPNDLTWSPDGAHLTYVDDGDLMQVVSGSGRASVLVGHEKLASLQSSAASEKDMDHRQRYNLAGYLWAPDSTHLLFDADGQLWIYDLRNGTGIQIAHTTDGSGDDPKFSPDGMYLSYLHNHNLQVRRLRDPGVPVSDLTSTRDENILNGEVDWVYLEELAVRSNYFWSPDSKQIAYLQMNETNVPAYPIVDWIPTHAQVDRQRYPQPGDANPDVHLGVVKSTGGKTNWIKLPIEASSDYIPRFGWVNSKTLWIETLARDHKHLNLYFADPGSGAVRLVLAQSDDKFFDESYDIHFSGNRFLFTSWKDGHNHIYLYSFDGGNPLANEAKFERQLTSGNFEVDGIKQVNESTQTVYYTSNEGDPRELQVWGVQMDGTGKHKISTTPGHHNVHFAPVGDYYADTASDIKTPPTVSMCDVKSKCQAFWNSKPLSEYAFIEPQFLVLKASDGTTLYATLLLPPGKTAAASVPLITNPYGGPHAQNVHNAWGGPNSLFDQVLAQHGFAVLHVDNRGQGNRGRDFAQAAYRNLGPVQFADQDGAVDQVLAKYPQLDPKRLGWWGWSWGGTFTLYAMTHSPRYIAGVAVAPVTDWRNYDSVYTERYMGQPRENPTGYHDNSVVNSAKDLKGKLLLVHGTGDDNVHIENDIQFIQKLIDADIPYDYQIYPRKTHSIAGPPARTHLFERILTHFEQNLMSPPQHVTAAGAN